MKVLLVVFDLYKSVGGGQTFYRSIIERNPSIDFHYLTTTEPASAKRPDNAKAIPFRRAYGGMPSVSSSSNEIPSWTAPQFIEAQNIASSVARMDFDVVDLPDFMTFGMFLRPALREHGVRFKHWTLSMHGVISRTLSMNWGTVGKSYAGLIAAERLQYLSADQRYGISNEYLDEFDGLCGYRGLYLDPLRCLPRPRPSLSTPGPGQPTLSFVGRTEKRKGPDLLIDLAWWLPQQSFQSSSIIGPDCNDHLGTSSERYLKQMAAKRLPAGAVRFEPTLDQESLDKLFRSRTVCVVPSRYDTLNFVALESLFAGCPTAIGSGAGVRRYLQDSFPEVPFVTIDVDNPYRSMQQLVELLNNYDDNRRHLVAALKQVDTEPTGDDLISIYQASPHSDAEAIKQSEEYYSLLNQHYKNNRSRSRQAISRIAHLGKPFCPPAARRLLRQALRPSGVRAIAASFVTQRLANSGHRNWLRQIRALTQTLNANNCKKAIDSLPERTASDLDAKAHALGVLSDTLKIGRAHIWSELARIEERRGFPLLAATYNLRVMRLAGRGAIKRVEHTADILNEHGFPAEATAVMAMFHPQRSQLAACEELLNGQNSTYRSPPVRDFAYLDDQRVASRPKVSVIVSMYNAAAKLPRFLNALALQTLATRGQLELVLIDSGSPDDELSVYRQMQRELGLSIVYARSAVRETIQSAWNRGIELSRGEYLSFLGVDETILPETLELLSKELDSYPAIDWIQANSLVTSVSERGEWLNDVMTYDRTGSHRSMPYLETCYLSWVGALYRRSIHDRFGYYDPTFRAAGDTEFKNRVLPYINTKMIPRTLGVFWNYPDERTTAHPRAEIEDLRAWYLHRTPAGMRNAFGNRDLGEVIELFESTLRYRKSYCTHISTDIEMACALAEYIETRSRGFFTASCFAQLLAVREAYRELDTTAVLRATKYLRIVGGISRAIKGFERQYSAQQGRSIPTCFDVFNDNRYEQHHWTWPSRRIEDRPLEFPVYEVRSALARVERLLRNVA